MEFLRVDHVPAAGDIVHARAELAVAAGGGAVAAVQLARWAGACTFYTALGDDELGRRAADDLRARGVDVRAALRPAPQRRAFTLVDAARERTILVVGDRLVPHAADPLPWDELATYDAVYLTGADPAAIHLARRARRLVATARILALLRRAPVPLDALVGSTSDPSERYTPGDLTPEPALVVRTDGARGGEYRVGGTAHRYAASPVTVTGDTYGAGDTFAAGLAYGLARDLPPAEVVADAAARAVAVLAWTGPYG
ncbi:MAG: ribokinase [Deltaproteobacteria bacterium]|nr:ribokinase [Deltaproteobacteria bacterium]